MATRTARQIINSAHTRLSILAGEEALSSADADASLVIMNAMMHGFEAAGISYVHADLALTDVVNVPDGLQQPLILMLAGELADPFGAQIGERLQKEIIAAGDTLQAWYWMQDPGIIDPILTPRRFGRFNILTGQ